MTADDIKHMTKTRVKGLFNINDPVWIKAFSEYNKLNTPVKMNCRICYDKVLLFHLHYKLA